MVLEKAKQWALENLIDEETDAILLVGAWARGEGTDVNDIDLVILKRYQLVAIAHIEVPCDGFTLDCWIHDRDSIHYELYTEPTDSNQITNLSLTLKFLKEAIIWYEREQFVEELKVRAENWTWDPKIKQLLEFDAEPPQTAWALNAFNESKKLLEFAKVKVDQGLPITHRRKDYPELNQDYGEQVARQLMEATQEAYDNLGIERDWPEFKDAVKALNHGNWTNAVASLKDVLRFIIRYELPSVPDQLLDPKLWTNAEKVHLSDPTLRALKIAFEN